MTRKITDATLLFWALFSVIYPVCLKCLKQLSWWTSYSSPLGINCPPNVCSSGLPTATSFNVSLPPSSLQLVTQYWISAAIRIFTCQIRATWLSLPWPSLCLFPISNFCFTLTHCITSKLKTVSTSGQSSHHVWHEAHPPSADPMEGPEHPNCTRMKEPQSSRPISFEIQI